ncbi:MAG TPA: riboflavin synthase [Actinomycetota bacterium]|jgi:riboflavin synthase
MFTGIIEERGKVVTASRRIVVTAQKVAQDSEPGASIAVNGVCLTVVDRSENGPDGFTLAFELSDESLARTSFGALKAGDPVNLERPLTLMSRLGGHLVQGHVDAVGEVIDVREDPTGTIMTIRFPEELGRYIVDKGSITVDGVSLTVVAPSEAEFSVALIPHTLQATSLGTMRPGARVNLEVDVLAKYVEGMVKERA